MKLLGLETAVEVWRGEIIVPIPTCENSVRVRIVINRMGCLPLV